MHVDERADDGEREARAAIAAVRGAVAVEQRGAGLAGQGRAFVLDDECHVLAARPTVSRTSPPGSE
jgi:hypothetical protein